MWISTSLSATNIMSFFMRNLAAAMIWCLVSLTSWYHLLHTMAGPPEDRYGS